MQTQERKDAKLKGADPGGGNVKQWESHVGGRVGFSACRRGAMKGPCCTDSLLVQPRIEAQGVALHPFKVDFLTSVALIKILPTGMLTC